MAINCRISMNWQKTYIFFLKSCPIRRIITITVDILSGILRCFAEETMSRKGLTRIELVVVIVIAALAGWFYPTRKVTPVPTTDPVTTAPMLAPMPIPMPGM